MTQFINGEWSDGNGQIFSSLSPVTGDEIWSGKAADTADVERALIAARNAFALWSMMSLEDRLEIVRRYGEIVSENKEELAALIALETGKVIWDARGEAGAMAGKIEISIKAYEERTGSRETVTGAMRSRLTHRPHGVMAIFGPYNFPGHLPNGHIVPALIAGNTVVFKPSELTPAVAEKMVSYWQEAGLPAGVLNLVQGAKDTGVALAGNAHIDGLLFTGSATTGRALARQLSERPEVITALEMGGNNALIVDEVEDLRAAVVMTINSAFISSGQRCTCARRLIVLNGSKGYAFIEMLKKAIDGITVGSGEDAYMGPVISADAAQAVLEAQADLVEKGAKILKPVKSLALGLEWLSPGLVDVTAVEDRPDEEIFGPLLQVIRVENLEEAISVANDTRFGLAAGLLSDSKAAYEYFYPRVRAGIVNWNQQLTGAASTAPFGGPGWSGNHRPSAYYAADYCAWPVASIENSDDKVYLAAMPQGLSF